ncbi:response regulator transcription factor [Thomasclavelia cocleata]|jgi:two-component system response regulator YesN|uniref:response regulator transcription factor n=1 Tax=Thomasclavelia cocleata TaxID=69824 RepID=UPI00255AD450|nr:response regulator [Thomasclavelia cocleata]
MYTIVIADDEVALRQAMIKRIDWKSIGFEVIGEAENGVEALELVERLEPDLLLTDIKMPFISGINLARKVREIRPAMQIAFLSGYDDFSYAQQAIKYNIIKYLLKPISSKELTKELVDIKEKMDVINQSFVSSFEVDQQQLLVERLLTPLVLDSDFVIDEKQSEYESYLNQEAVQLEVRASLEEKTRYLVMVIRYFDKRGKNITDRNHLLGIKGIVKKYLRFGSFYSGKKIITLLSGQAWEIEKYVNIIVNEIVQSSERILCADCYLGLSSISDSLMKANLLYSEAMSAVEYGQSSRRSINFIGDIKRTSMICYEDVDKIASKIEKLIKSGGADEIELYLSSIFVMFIDQGATRADIDLLMIRIISSTCALVYSVCDAKSSALFFNKTSELSSIFNKHSFNEKRMDLIGFCLLSKSLIKKQKKMNSEVICDELMEIIDKEYGNEELSLGVVSESLHVSISYLSSLVKKNMGETFITLLTKKRMEVAKELVLYSSAKVLEIAYKCGYSDQHYFSYCFKKQYGISPNKMREQNLVSSNEK